jgi:hypothetical protein
MKQALAIYEVIESPNAERAKKVLEGWSQE